MDKKILQIESIEATELLSQFAVLKKQILFIKKRLQKGASLTLMRRKETSEFLGVSYVTLNDWARKGILPTYKIGNLIYYKRADIESAMIAIKPRKSEAVQYNSNHSKNRIK